LLTGRQLDVLQLLSKGLSNKEIASELFLSTRTVDMHMRNLFDRLGCHSRWDAVEKGRELGLI
ncbi:LuxR C-terminal-related transcriptional regulator, partial [Arthrospira platensis SPKY1]|nr:LuxR C-terminal-related transcriptional regulator [Arthrospira platensis SPKY1]